jgi:hypothetical protein
MVKKLMPVMAVPAFLRGMRSLMCAYMIWPEPLENPKPKNNANRIGSPVSTGNTASVIRMPAIIAKPAIMTLFLERRIESDIHPQIGLPMIRPMLMAKSRLPVIIGERPMVTIRKGPPKGPEPTHICRNGKSAHRNQPVVPAGKDANISLNATDKPTGAAPWWDDSPAFRQGDLLRSYKTSIAITRLLMAKRRNVVRQPNHSVSHTSGVAAAIFPAVPTETRMAERVAK